MDEVASKYLRAVGYILFLIGLLMALYKLVPSRLDIAWVCFLAAVASLIGGGIWTSLLVWLKSRGSEDLLTSPFGGTKREPNLPGGILWGIVQFLPLGVVLTASGITVHDVDPVPAIIPPLAFILGTSIGSALFYGLRIRERIEAKRLHHIPQEFRLAVIWSHLVLAPAYLLYAAAVHFTVGAPNLFALFYLPAALLVSCLLIYVSILMFLILCTSSTDTYEPVRGFIAGYLIVFAPMISLEALQTYLSNL